MKEFELDCWKCERMVEEPFSFWNIFSWIGPHTAAVFYIDPQEDCEVCHGHGYVFHNGANYRAPDVR